MNKKNLFMLLLLIAIAVNLNAQIKIGDKETPPSAFSILELVSNQQRGLRVPQLDFEQKNELQDALNALASDKKESAEGLQIYNKTSRCVETWNGIVWLQDCGPEGPRPATGMVAIAPSIDGNEITYREFMSYNLGAQEISIKEQLLHASPTNDLTPANVAQQQAYTKVYGSLYQWGRKKDGHQNVWSEKTATTTGVSESLLNTATGQVDPDKDTNNDYYGKFILGSYGSSKYDWITENTSSANHYGTDAAIPYYHMYPGRWDGCYDSDNGSYTPLTTAFPSSKVKVTNGNDPCPAGFRIPSKVEWAAIFTGALSGSSVCSGGINEWVWVSLGHKLNTYRGFESETDDKLVATSGYLIYPATDATVSEIDEHVTVVYSYAPAPTLFIPAAGYLGLVDGSYVLNGSGNDGSYWSSTAAENEKNYANSYYLDFYNGSAYPSAKKYRGFGFSVRCVAD
jgi:uncharacterized protein (TIGR02145 family)